MYRRDRIRRGGGRRIIDKSLDINAAKDGAPPWILQWCIPYIRIELIPFRCAVEKGTRLTLFQFLPPFAQSILGCGKSIVTSLLLLQALVPFRAVAFVDSNFVAPGSPIRRIRFSHTHSLQVFQIQSFHHLHFAAFHKIDIMICSKSFKIKLTRTADKFH